MINPLARTSSILFFAATPGCYSTSLTITHRTVSLTLGKRAPPLFKHLFRILRTSESLLVVDHNFSNYQKAILQSSTLSFLFPFCL